MGDEPAVKDVRAGGGGMSERNKVRVRICNDDYVFVSPATGEHLLQLAELVESQIKEIMERDARLGKTRAAVMTAMILADAMMGAEKKLAEFEGQLETIQFGRDEVEAELRRVKATAAKRAKRKGRR